MSLLKITIPQRNKPFTMEIPIEQILPWVGNPTARTSEKATTLLLATIEESKTIAEVVGVNNGDDTVTLGDGHRRLFVAKKLGYKRLTVRVFPNSYTPGDLYILFNTGVRGQSAADSLEAYVLGDVLPKNGKLASNIKFCVRICGSKAEVRRVMLDGTRRVSPNVANTVYSAVTLLDGRSERSGKGGQITISDRHRQVFAWIVKYGDNSLRKAISTPLWDTSKKVKRIKAALRDDCDLEI